MANFFQVMCFELPSLYLLFSSGYDEMEWARALHVAWGDHSVHLSKGLSWESLHSPTALGSSHSETSVAAQTPNRGIGDDCAAQSLPPHTTVLQCGTILHNCGNDSVRGFGSEGRPKSCYLHTPVTHFPPNKAFDEQLQLERPPLCPALFRVL